MSENDECKHNDKKAGTQEYDAYDLVLMALFDWESPQAGERPCEQSHKSDYQANPLDLTIPIRIG